MIRSHPERTLGWVTVATVIVGFVSLSVGAIWIAPWDVVSVMVDHLTPFKVATNAQTDAIVWNIRMPRMVVAAVVGAMLGAAGVVLQGSFRNPIIDAHLVGISAFGSVGALMGFWAGYATVGPHAAVVVAAATGLVGAWLVRRVGGRIAGVPSRFVLVGLASGLAVSAVVAAASIAIHDPRIPDVSFWFFGGLAGATWTTAGWLTLVVALSLAALFPLAGRLDVLALGESAARNIGVNVSVVLAIATSAVGIGVGASVGAAGVIAFVGLVSARVAVDAVGAAHRWSIVTATVLGSGFLVGADAVGRLAGGGFEIPVGLITTTFGGLYLARLVASGKVRV